jgi:hypothetical protein
VNSSKGPDWTEPVADWLTEELGLFRHLDAGEIDLNAHRLSGLLDRLRPGADSGDQPVGVFWEDACVIVLRQIEACNLMRPGGFDNAALAGLMQSYGLPPEEMDPMPDTADWIEVGETETVPALSIAPRCLTVLGSLGLLNGNVWSDVAHIPVWRVWQNMPPSHWTGDAGDWPDATPAFREMLTGMIQTVPSAFTRDIEPALRFTPDDWKRHSERHGVSDIDADRDYLAGYIADAKMLDVSFALETNWRATRGWLDAQAQAQCYTLGFDGLFQRMAEAFVIAQYPDTDLAKGLSARRGQKVRRLT